MAGTLNQVTDTNFDAEVLEAEGLSAKTRPPSPHKAAAPLEPRPATAAPLAVTATPAAPAAYPMAAIATPLTVATAPAHGGSPFDTLDASVAEPARKAA